MPCVPLRMSSGWPQQLLAARRRAQLMRSQPPAACRAAVRLALAGWRPTADAVAPCPPLFLSPPRPADTKFGYLADKDIWDEAW